MHTIEPRLDAPLLNPALVSFGLFLFATLSFAADWPGFRGPNGSGISDGHNLPVVFGTNTNLLWKTTVPAGNSSPVIAGDRVFLAGYKGEQRIASCFDRKNGVQLWERSIQASRIERKTGPNDPASSTPVVDGQNLYVLFSGFGLVSYTVDGRERWRTALEPFSQPHGMSSSPLMADNLIIILADQVTNSHIAAFETSTGKLKWRTPRPNFVGGYSTPLFSRGEIVAAGPLELVAYAPATGARLWSAGRMGVMPVSSPICDGDRFFVNNGAVPPFESLIKDLKADRNGDGKLTPDEFPDPSFREAVLAIDRAYGNGDGAVDKQEWDGALKLMQTLNALVAVRIDGTQRRELWRMTRSLPEVSSPLLYQDVLYLIKDGGILTSINPADGKIFKQERLTGVEGRYFASPVAADGKLFVVNESGKAAVIKAGREWQLLAVNDLGERCYATPALANGKILVRTSHILWSFGSK